MEESASRKGALPFTNSDGGDYISPGNRGLPVSMLPDESYYKMDHPKQGLALIFNHESYAGKYASSRPGTNIDCEKLEDCLDRLRFEVRVYPNLESKAIEEVLADVAGMDHTDYNCLVVAVLTHGETGVLYAYDETYSADIIWASFTAQKCPSLKNKPKIFFIQACQGSKTDAGVTRTVKQRTATDGRDHGQDRGDTHGQDHSHGNENFRIRSYADFLIAHSTVPGYYAWRSSTKGSWFIRALCQALDEDGKQYDLLTILTFVCRRVAVDFESHTEERSMNKKKQNPCITSMLTRLVQFA